jgi:hypothetical protein
MRTTIDIHDDVLAEAEEIAAAQNTSVGAVISDLARKFLKERPLPGARFATASGSYRNATEVW